MSATQFFIRSFSAIDTDGLYSKGGYQTWDSDQSGPLDVRRPQVLSSIFPLFGKLNAPDKLAFSAASLCLSDVSDPGGEKTGITLGIPYGSLSTDISYMKSIGSGFPSPAFFSATLPSSPVADIAIYFGMKGPNRIFAGGDCPGLCALDTAGYLLSGDRAENMLVLAVWESGITEKKYPGANNSASDGAVAFFCTSNPENNTIAQIEIEFNGGISDNKKCGLDQKILMMLINTIMKKEQSRISVSEKGFEGYISVSL